jgi:hypothetical protein
MRQLWELVFTLSLGGHIVADTLVKPIELALPAGGVRQESVKQKNQAVQRTIVGPLSLDPPARYPIAQSSFSVKPNIEVELAEIRTAWRIYRSTNTREAVYLYLSKVFAVVSRWQRGGCALKKARAALRLRPNPPQMKSEPFGIVIFCTADSKIVDDKTRSKWSRVLRYAVRAKPEGQRLIDFIKSNGGINECASGFTRSRQMVC